jgi:hypothetical protein
MKRVERNRVGATPGKLALVGVLGVVLAYVIVSNLGGMAGEESGASDVTSEAEAVADGAPVTDDATPQVVSGNPFGDFAEDQNWPKTSLDSLISFDPMRAPEWMAPAELTASPAGDEENASTLDELRAAASAIIMVADGHRVARIGTQDYHVGDFVGPYQITDISSAGIILSEPKSDR